MSAAQTAALQQNKETRREITRKLREREMGV